MDIDPAEVLSPEAFADHAARQGHGQAWFEKINTYPGPSSEYAYYDAGIVGFVFGEMWPRPGLTIKERRWITLVCVGQADTPAPLKSHVWAALNSGDCTVEELDEFTLFYACHMGWPKGAAVNAALIESQQRLEAEQGVPYAFPVIVPWHEPASPVARRARGKDAYEKIMLRPAPAGNTPFKGPGYLDFLFGENWTRPVLSLKERRIIAITCAAASNADRDAEEHVYAALKSGDITKNEMDELGLHFAVLMGWLPARRLDDLVQAVWDSLEEEPRLT
jgi:4-carboxymuconolactone decarboxylase